MAESERVIATIRLPLGLPGEVFLEFEQERRMLDLDLLARHLPAELGELINWEGTVLQSQKGSQLRAYYLLTDGHSLKVTVEACGIVALERL